MREVEFFDPSVPPHTASLLACLATILELPPERLPRPTRGEDPASGWTVSRWLGGLGMGLARVADPASFSWGGPWIACVRPPHRTDRRYAVMYGVPSGVVWDPGGDGEIEKDWIEAGFLVAAADIALALPSRFAFLPQFVSPREPRVFLHMLGLSAVFMLLTFVVFVGYGVFAASVRNHVISRPRVMAWMRRVFAGSFVALGATLALASR